MTNNYNPNDVSKEWSEAERSDPLPPRLASSIKRKHLNVPFTDTTSPLEQDGLPFVSHSPEHTAPFLSHAKAREAYYKQFEALTSNWGPSLPCQIDLDRLKEATTQLITGALNGDLGKVRRALDQGADPDTLVLVRDVCSKDPTYFPAPLGVACAMYQAHTKDRMMQEARKEVVRALCVRDGKSLINVGPSPETGSMAVGFSLPGIVWGGEAEYRQVPLTFGESSVLTKFVPESMDQPVQRVSSGVAYGEELPKELENTYMDLYDPGRDTLRGALDQFRQAKMSIASAPQTSAPKKGKIG